MNYKAEYISDESLTAEEIMNLNVSIYDEITYLKVTYKGETIFIKDDCMEPEDTRFCRDLSWIADALEQAYTIGLNDNQNTHV